MREQIREKNENRAKGTCYLFNSPSIHWIYPVTWNLSDSRNMSTFWQQLQFHYSELALWRVWFLIDVNKVLLCFYL